MLHDMILGVDIGGTKSAVALGEVNEEGGVTIADRRMFATEARRGPDYALQRLRETLHEILDRPGLQRARVRGIGISCGGPLNSSRGLILSPPNLPGWDQIPIVDLFEREFGLPAWLQNDANAGALAEWRFGAGRGLQNLIFCTFGTGFGAGLILNGRLYTGASDMAGEIGHVRLAAQGPVGYGKRGSVEGFCSGGGLAQLARQYVLERWQRGEKVAFCDGPASLEKLTAQTISEAARAGEPLAIEIYRELGRWLGQTLSLMIDLLNPEMIVLGGIFFRQRDLIWPETARVLGEESLQQSLEACRVVPAALGEQIGDYASLAVAFERLYGMNRDETVSPAAPDAPPASRPSQAYV